MLGTSCSPPKRTAPRKRSALLASLLALVLLAGAARASVGPGAAGRASTRASASIPRPIGLYVLDDVSDMRPAAKAYPNGLFTDTTYLQHIDGHAIFVPIAKIIPSIPVWGQFHYQWGFLDTLVLDATTHGKAFSIELESGFETKASTYPEALPDSFAISCGADCAPLFNVWVIGGSGGQCTSAYVMLPWVPQVQQFWSVTAESLAAHLHDIGAYGSLTLVHVPGLSVYDEELRLPTGSPTPSPSDTLPCPDQRPAYPSVIDDAAQSRWVTYGYSDSAVIAGFDVIANAFGQAFPDRFLGLSLFPHGSGAGIAFPNFTSDSAGYVAAQLVQEVGVFAGERLQLQSDNLDSGTVVMSVISLAHQDQGVIGWQTNKHGGNGAGCAGGGAGSCLPDGPDSPYLHLMQYGAAEGAHYLEIWPNDVLTYPQSIAAAAAEQLYSTASVDPGGVAPVLTELGQNAPNPFTDHAWIAYRLAKPGRVVLDLYDVAGRRVRALVDGFETAGLHEVIVDRAGLRAGVYFYRLSAGGSVGRRRMVLLR